MPNTKYDDWLTTLLVKTITNIRSLCLTRMLPSGQVRRGQNDAFINSGCGMMGYTFEKWLRAKEEELWIFSAWCFWDYEICRLNGLASLVQQSWHAAANTLWLLQSAPEQGCFKGLTLATSTLLKTASNTSSSPHGNIKKENNCYYRRWFSLTVSDEFWCFCQAYVSVLISL